MKKHDHAVFVKEGIEEVITALRKSFIITYCPEKTINKKQYDPAAFIEPCIGTITPCAKGRENEQRHNLKKTTPQEAGSCIQFNSTNPHFDELSSLIAFNFTIVQNCETCTQS